MSSNGKGNTAKTYAEAGLEETNQYSAEAEASIAPANGNAEQDQGEFVQVAGTEPVAYYFRHTAPKKTPKNPFKILEKGQTLQGVYVRSYSTGKFNNPTHLVRLSTGELVGVPGSGSLNKAINRLAEGSEVKITYNGMTPIKGGEFEGTDAHNYTVFGRKLKA